MFNLIITNFIYYILPVLGVLYIFVKYKFSYWKKRGVPYLEPTIPYGNLGNIGKTESRMELFDRIYKNFKGQDLYAGAYFLISPSVIFTDLNLIQRVMISDFNIFSDRGLYYNDIDDPLSGHLFNLGGKKWKVVRAKLTPTFTSGKIKYMFPTIINVSKYLKEVTNDMIKNNSIIEMRELLARFTTDVIGTCAFGIECNSLKDPNVEFRKYGQMVFEMKDSTLSRSFRTQFPDLAKKFHVTVIRKSVSNFFMNVVKETIEYREKNNIHRKDFMDLLLGLKNIDSLSYNQDIKINGLTNDEIAAQAFLFFIAAYETSSSTTSFCLYELALNQEIQDRVREEIENVLNETNGEITYEAIMKLKYMDQVIKETLRKYPSVPFLTRRSTADYKVPGTNKIIEKGTFCVIPVYSIHNDPDIYPNPEKFNPENFSSDAIKSRHPISFLGFGDGPRICIGERFGLVQTRIGLLTILKNFRVKICDKTQIPIVFSMKHALLSNTDGIYLNVERI